MFIKMEKINLNTIEDLTRFQNEINNVINEHKTRKELEIMLESVPALRFCELKALFESISEKLFNTPNGGAVIKNYVKFIKESKTLKGLFSLHEAIFKTNNVANSSLFLNEALTIVSNGINKKAYQNEVHKLGEIVREGLKLVNATTEEIKHNIANVSKVSESIDYIYTNKKTLNNLNEFIDKYSTITMFINENKQDVFDAVENIASADDYMKYMNEMANTMDEDWKKRLLENICLSNLSGGSNETVFNTYKESCLTMLGNALNECEDIQTRSTFESMRDNLERKVFLEENFVNDVVNLAELEETLK